VPSGRVMVSSPVTFLMKESPMPVTVVVTVPSIVAPAEVTH
jgi:hypothetical protein